MKTIVWKKNILSALNDLSDIEFQKSAWAGKHSKYISSFTEVLAQLYDSLDFERFIKYYEYLNGKDEIYKLSTELNIMINEYSNYGYSTELKIDGYKIILSDNKWINITNKAKKLVDLLKEKQM